MNLPHYFLADLPPEAEVTASMVSEACRAVKRNREKHLLTRTTASVVARVADLAKEWLSPDFSFRKLALEHGPAETGFSAGTIAKGLDSFFEEITEPKLRALIAQDIGDWMRLEDFVFSAEEAERGVAGTAVGPELMAHIAAGNIPNPTLMSLVLGLVTRSAQFVKCSKGASLLPRLFLHSLQESDRTLASCIEIAEWRSSGECGSSFAKSATEDKVRNAELTQILISEADCVTVTGSDEALAAIRQQVPVGKRFLGYGHRVSFGYVSNGVLTSFHAKRVAARAADDVVAWNQLGCLSPHVIYVEHSGAISVEQFSAMLAEELAAREKKEPRGELPVEVAASIASRRSIYDLRAAYSEEEPEAVRTRIWSSQGSTAWTVVYESEPRFQSSCLHRFIYVKGVTDLHEALRSADAVREKVSTVGIAATEDKMPAMALQLARWGATRVCPLGKMQRPPITWRHDGRPALGDLVRWTDWEAL